MKIFELTPQQVIGLYKKHGLRPISGTARVISGCTCALGVLAVENGTPYKNQESYDETLPPIEDLRENCITGFGLGFDKGFDGCECPQLASDLFKKGYEIGVAVAAAVKNGEL